MEGWFSSIKRSPLATLLLAITYFMSGLVINLGQLVLWVGVRPFNKSLYRRLNYYLAYSLYSQLVFLAEWWSGCDVMVYIDREDFDKYYGKEHGYLIMNHAYDIDWLMGWVFCDRIRLLGNCKTYAKKVLQYIPTMGWAWKFGESVFLERNWEKDKEIISKQLKELVEYPSPIWLLLFAEGTRFSEHKHAASMKFAKERGLPLLKHHLVPRTRGFTSSIPHLKEKMGAIYDVQLAFKKDDKIEPSMSNLLIGKGVTAHLYIRRIPMDGVPTDEQEANQWLHELYQRKDQMQDSFYNTGDFFKENDLDRVEPFLLPRRKASLINWCVWFVVTLVPMSYWLACLLTSGSTVKFSIGAAIIASFFFLLYKIVGMTKISKASSYGSDAKRD
ncbi:Hypothetical predicted protein [Cloeon dipterum]|uniref:Phospholipid/glycerol acyltransferase domain-containing protein n=3 Tax=Cloeon dipterum TaxID=197152 RepID=A0A8S1CHE4_9INSE|nr:Hypothetical predicted protein [Cloeon dipterum]